MKKSATPPHKPKAKFGTLLGIAPGNVPVYSSDYESATPAELPDRQAYRSFINNIFLGYKWQCVEFARRWLYINKGYIFDDIAMAHDIFRLQHVRVVEDNSLLPLKSFRNGSKRHPEVGCLLIWEEGGEFRVTGHVAIISEVYNNKIRFIEQNVEDAIWPENQNYSRELTVSIDADNRYWITCDDVDAEILGWLIQTSDPTHAEIIPPFNKKLLTIISREIHHDGQAQKAWLDVNNPDELAYVTMMHGHKLTSVEEDQYKYYCITSTAEKELKRATNELHAMFMHATNFVLRDDKLLKRFCIPEKAWPKLHESWNNRKNEMITGRFDFTMSENGLKLYEYNSDSASCHMECGKVQIKWADNFQCNDGKGSGDDLFDQLVEAWQDKGIDEVVHILYDDDLEETYHAYFMKSAIEKAGLQCKAIKGVAGFRFDDQGQIIDGDGIQVKRVWKTWAWETALDQIRLDPNEHLTRISDAKTSIKLADILLEKNILVYEPFWTLIPSNKAILPILWMLYPNHPYLLNSQYELNDEIRKNGYVIKPIVGRYGSNICIFDKNNELIIQTDGKFDNHDVIYQELFSLPCIDNYRVQINTFSVDGCYAGACTRVNTSMILTTGSDIYPLRIIADPD